MTAILTCGHPCSGFELANEALVVSGMAPPRPARPDSMAASQFHEALFKAGGMDPTGLGAARQVTPDRAWQQIAADIVASNARQDWAWADARAVWLLDFWKSSDPQMRFVLVYGGPELAIAQVLRGLEPRPDDVGPMVASWSRCNDEMLRFYYRNPERCMLVNSAAVRQSPAGFVQAAANRFGVRTGAPAAMQLGADAASTSWVQVAMARSFVEDFPQAAALYADLESASDMGALDPAVAAAGRLLAWREHAATLARIEELEAASALAADLSKETEVQKLQVLQLQEELGEVFADLQARRGCTLPADVAIDMRRPLNGANWYDPEVDGRWAGPANESVVKLAPMADGVLELQLDVVDAMDPEILQEMEISMNGVPLELAHDWQGYPALVSGRLATADIPQQDEWELRFRFPRLVSPGERGLDDHRQLAIRLRAFRLKLVDDGPAPILV